MWMSMRSSSGPLIFPIYLSTWGTVQLQFEASVTRFGDLSPEDRMPERIGD